MSAERLPMRKIREVIRLRALKVPVRGISIAVHVSPSTVSDYLQRAKKAGLVWPLPDDLTDDELEKRLFVRREDQPPSRPIPDWSWVHKELRGKGVTLSLLWQEYKGQHPDGYEYSQFCELYGRWCLKLAVWMRQTHLGGEKLFVDFSGDGIPFTNPITGEVRMAQLFVATLGASNYTFACAVASQRMPDWIEAHEKAFAFFGGVPKALVPDQPKTAIKRSCRYEPEPNPTYADLARHYGTSIFPARPRKPRDKAKVEGAVLLAQRWIIAVLRHRTFFSIAEINEAIAPLLERLNTRPMRKIRRSRKELFLELDAPKLQPLPAIPYEYAEWKIDVRVNFDYHVEFEDNYYSVPFRYAHQLVDIRGTGKIVELIHKHERVASHLRCYEKRRTITDPEHMPSSHLAHAEWTAPRIINWASTIGPSTTALVKRMMDERECPEQAFRACRGILRLAKQYPVARLEKAAARAVACGSCSYKAVDLILKNKLEEQPVPKPPTKILPRHANVRGSSYFG